MRDPRAGAEAGHAGARLVTVELCIDVAHAGDALIGQETIGPAADHLVQQRAGRGVRQPLWHHDGHQAGGLAQSLRQQREGTLQAELHELVGGRGQLVRRVHHCLAERVPDRPAPQAGHHVARQHLAAVVEQQPVTQREFPGFRPVFDGIARQHLRLGVANGIEREQRIEHHHYVVAGNEGAAQRVEQRKIRIRNEFQGGGGGGAHDPWPGQARGADYGGGVEEKLASFHPTFPICRRHLWL